MTPVIITCALGCGWESEFRSVQQPLDHLARKTKSESSRRHYLEWVYPLYKK